jgi:hypothetical protein
VYRAKKLGMLGDLLGVMSYFSLLGKPFFFTATFFDTVLDYLPVILIYVVTFVN